MTDLLQRVKILIQSRNPLPRGKKILVAVSGGIDSMVLLHALEKLSSQNHWKIVVAHFNHQLRGRASDADEKLVRKTAAILKLPVMVERKNTKQFAAKSKLSVEMAARKLRHEFFARAAQKQKIKTIALAHHADDQVELFFLRLLRGAGGEGLSGMKFFSASPADKKIRLIRPLLDFTKAELQKFARENKIRFRADATNFSADFLRNRIRNELLPLLKKKYQAGLAKTVLRLMEIVGAESDVIGEIAKNWLKNRKPDFAQLPAAIQRRVLQSQLIEQNVPADFDLIESVRQSPEVFVNVSPKFSVARNGSGAIEVRPESKPEFKTGKRFVNLEAAKRVKFAGVFFNWQSDAAKNFGRGKNKTAREFFDADKIGEQIVLRHWRAGDRFQPIGLRSPAKLQDLFTNAKIPRARRRDLVLATTVRGEIFWIEDFRISEDFKITPQTKRRLVWDWKRIEN